MKGRILFCSILMSWCVWAAEWISAAPEHPSACDTVAFARRIVNEREVVKASWRVTGLGVFEAYVNGRAASEDMLKPGYTEPAKCKHAFTCDVTELLDRRSGATNVLSALVTSGWWRGGLLKYGKESAFFGELTLTYADGTAEVIGTDTSWRAAKAGPVRKAGIYYGEDYDAREDVSWMRHGCVDWPAAVVNREFSGEIRDLVGPPVRLRRDLEMKPRSMSVLCGVEGATPKKHGKAVVVRSGAADVASLLEPGETLVVDFGQNAAAVPSFNVEGAAGTRLTIRTAEMLNDGNGEKVRGNDGPAGTPYRANLRGIRAGIDYILCDGAQSYETRFSYFGYRYISFTCDRPVTLRNVRSTPISSVSAAMECGTLETGNDAVNRLVSNVRWGMLSNYLSVPTDCPQRDERLGWTADTQIFMDTALYLADVKDFLRKYLADMRDAQREDGCYRVFAPTCRHKQLDKGASAGWADAGILIPYRLWKRTGDLDIVRESWRSMLRYMDFLDSVEGPNQHDNGDWLSFEHLDPEWHNLTQSVRYKKGLALIYWIWDAALMQEMAGALGDAPSQERFAALESRIRLLFAKRYVGPDGMIGDYWKGQCFDLFALKFRLCATPDAYEKTRCHLLDDIRAHGNCLQTGFLGTSVIMDVLTTCARSPDMAYMLLLQRKCPSWLYSVDQGATTVWERWNSYTIEKGFGPMSMNSFNHYAYGCVVEWLFAHAAGIRADPSAPGFRRFLLEPKPDMRLGHLSATYRSPAGLIRSAWRYGLDGTLSWRYSVPSGAEARIRMPDGRMFVRGEGEYEETISGEKRNE